MNDDRVRSEPLLMFINCKSASTTSRVVSFVLLVSHVVLVAYAMCRALCVWNCRRPVYDTWIRINFVPRQVRLEFMFTNIFLKRNVY